MNKTIIRMVFIFLVGLVISSCRINQSTITHSNELSFQQLYPFKMNENILVKVEPSSQETFRYGSNIHIVIENKSEQEIFFPVGFGIKMFVVRNNNWVEVQDKNSYYGEGSLLPSKSSEII